MDIADLMRPEYMRLEMSSRDKNGVIRELIALLANAGVVSDEEGMYESVLLREKEFSTGIGFGIAIPHAKCKWVSRPAVAFGRCADGIVWTGEEDTDVDLVFLIAVPDDAENQHLKLIAKISRKLVHAEVRDQIRCACDPQSVIDVLST